MRGYPRIPPDNERCQKNNVSDGTGWHYDRCKRRGAVKEENKLWCKQHAPSAEAARSQESSKRWDQKMQRCCPKCGHTGPSWEFILPPGGQHE